MLELVDYYALFFVLPFIALDLIKPNRQARPQRGWHLRATVISVGALATAILVGRLWMMVLPAGSLFEGSRLGAWGGAAVGILVYQLCHYAYHRAAHSWNWLWRLGHQMHHAAESVDSFGAYYIHPFDAALFTTWAVLVFGPLLGLSPAAGALSAAFLAFNAAFQHASVRTPRWLGFIVQRPEGHMLHHARGEHRGNYADLPLWDLVFGTFRNPAERPSVDIGFWDGASSQLAGLLIGRDVAAGNHPSVPAPNPGREDRPAATRRGDGELKAKVAGYASSSHRGQPTSATSPSERAYEGSTL